MERCLTGVHEVVHAARRLEAFGEFCDNGIQDEAAGGRSANSDRPKFRVRNIGTKSRPCASDDGFELVCTPVRRGRHVETCSVRNLQQPEPGQIAR